MKNTAEYHILYSNKWRQFKRTKNNKYMKIKEVKLDKFKRFTDLTITGIPQTAKLVVLVGPNGCGKTSVFEAFNHWYKYKGFRNYGNQDFYLKEGDKDVLKEANWYDNRVNIQAYDSPFQNNSDVKGKFYFRTAHRNEPDFTTTNLSKQDDPKEMCRYSTLMTTDAAVSENYQRLVSNTLSGVFNEKNNDKLVKDLREELTGQIKKSLSSVFDDLQLSSIGNPLVNGSFYFTKGRSENFHYKNLSAGEKSAFDLILDLVIKTTFFQDTVFCIDEPEIHMHTALQARLLGEMYELIPNNSQLWLSTHSIGMLQKAKEIEQDSPNTVCFLDFSDIDFDSATVLTPVRIDSTIWKKFLELTFGDFAKLVAPRRIVFCEGTPKGRKYKNFDAQIYNRIFSTNYPDVSFVSIGSCNELENKHNISIQIVNEILKNSEIIKFVDRDDKSVEEIAELNANNIKVLSKRHIECYLLDDEIIKKLCISLHKEDKIDECFQAKQKAVDDSVKRGNPADDIKSASGDIYVSLKNILSLNKCGNTTEAFLRDTMAPLITDDTSVYKDLEEEILIKKQY